HGGKVHAIAFCPGGGVLASASQDRVVRLWDAATGKQLHRFRGHQNPALAVAAAPDGRLLASAAARENAVRMWDVASGEELRQLRAEPGWIRSLAFAPDGRTLAAIGAEDTLHLWDVATGRGSHACAARQRHPPAGQGENAEPGIRHVAFSANGRLLAACANDGTVSLWDPATAQEFHPRPADPWPGHAIAFAPPGT